MRIPGRFFWCRSVSAWQFTFGLAVFAFLLRAFIPLGYMPAPATHGLPFAVTLCSSAGPVSVPTHHPHDSHHPANDHSQLFENCPFGLSLAFKLMPGADSPSLFAELVYLVVPAFTGKVSSARRSVLGPPLGSRAPPMGNLHYKQ